MRFAFFSSFFLQIGNIFYVDVRDSKYRAITISKTGNTTKRNIYSSFYLIEFSFGERELPLKKESDRESELANENNMKSNCSFCYILFTSLVKLFRIISYFISGFFSFCTKFFARHFRRSINSSFSLFISLFFLTIC